MEKSCYFHCTLRENGTVFVCLKGKRLKTYNFRFKGGNFQMLYCKLLPEQEMTI
jgi:hypothetical protein